MVARRSGLQGQGCWVSCKLRKHTVLTGGFCCPSALSPGAVTSTLPDWRIPVEIVPDSTSDLYNFQVSPMPSTSEGMCFWGLPACLFGSWEGFSEGGTMLKLRLELTELTVQCWRKERRGQGMHFGLRLLVFLAAQSLRVRKEAGGWEEVWLQGSGG